MLISLYYQQKELFSLISPNTLMRDIEILSVEIISFDVGRNFGLPLVSVVEELLLVVKQLLVGLGRKLKVGALHDRVDRARLLAETAVDASGKKSFKFCHLK